MLVVREVSFSEHIDSVGKLLADNWKETGFGFDFELDVGAYRRFETLGLLLAVAAFDGESIIGYSTAMIAPHPYNPGIVCANSDALFVQPAYRNGRTALLLLRETERAAKSRNARYMLWHTRGGTRFADMLERRGYAPADVIMMREL